MIERKIVLASKSPRRRELLSAFVPDLEIMVDSSDEVVEEGLSPEETVKRLALKKAENVASMADGSAIIIAADTVVFIDGEILGKPATYDEAASMLYKLSGREHFVCTGFSVIDNQTKKTICDFERTVVRFKTLSDSEIEKYVETGEPMDKAGAYGIQGIGSVFVEGIQGDYFNVVGLPLCSLAKMLKNEFEIELF